MLKNYIKVAFRNLSKNKIYGAINVVGLAVGIACCLFILLYIQDEWSYDRYHKKSDNIYRGVLDLNTNSGTRHLASSPAAFAPAAEEEFAAIQESVRLYRSQPVATSLPDKQFNEERFFYADSSFFNLFSFTLSSGNPETALRSPYSVVLTQETARRYFGDENPIGRSITVSDTLEFEVTGVFVPIPSQSHFQFDFVASMDSWKDMVPSIGNDQSWAPHIYHTYLLLTPGASPELLERKFSDLVNQRVDLSGGFSFDFQLQPLTDIHLYSHRENELQANSYASTTYLFGAVGLFILLIACFNFVNLSTARSEQRIKEVGIRKTLGAERRQLLGQFMGEAFLMSLIALILGLLLIDILLPFLNSIADKQLELKNLAEGYLPLWLAGSVLFVAFAAGAYPALFLSAFKPMLAMKGKEIGGVKGFSLSLRKSLVILQFAISISLIVSTVVVFRQLQFMMDHDLGFEADQVLVLPALNGKLLDRAQLLKGEALRKTNIHRVSISSNIPGRGAIAFSVRTEDMPPDEWQAMNTQFVDPDYVETYQMEVIAGRDFSAERQADSTNVFILNETAASEFGWTPSEAVGKRVALKRGGGRVIGVVKDFNYNSLQQSIEPLVIVGSPVAYGSAPLYLSMRVNTSNVSDTITGLEETWKSIVPNRTFSYFFLNDDFNSQYLAEQRLSKISTLFSVLAIIIACMGLFGLATFAAERRIKEIGIRKVLGATIPNIIGLLGKDFLKLIVIGFAISIPVAWYAMNLWLADFAYHIEISPGIFAIAGGATMLIALVTVSWQSIRAAVANPVESLKNE